MRVRRARRGRRSEPRVWIRTAAQREEQRRLRAHADELGEETRRLRAQLHEATAAKAELQAAAPCNMLCGARNMQRAACSAAGAQHAAWQAHSMGACNIPKFTPGCAVVAARSV
jgi:hypothetical protein